MKIIVIVELKKSLLNTNILVLLYANLAISKNFA